MASKLLEKSRYPWKLTVNSVLVLLLLPVVVVSTSVDTVPHRTWENFSWDLCTFTTFPADKSLLERGLRATRTMLLEEMKKIKASLPELHHNDPDTRNTTREVYRRQLQIAANYVLKMLEDIAAAFLSSCQQQSSNQCRLEKSEQRGKINQICATLGWIKRQIKRLRDTDFEQQNVMGKLQLADKNSFKNNTTKQTLSWKQIQIRKTESTKSGSRRKRAATAYTSTLWDDGVIPYVIDDIFTVYNKRLFKRVMRHWEEYTCLTFKEKEPVDQDYILITQTPCGCCSSVGKQGGVQIVSIGRSCIKFGAVLHQLGHAIGFWHEHSRPDRDQYVEIIHTNIRTGEEYKFHKQTFDKVNSLGEPYDFESIMHYRHNAYAHNKSLDTILPIVTPMPNIRVPIHRRLSLSAGDIRQTNKLYKCPKCGGTLQESQYRVDVESAPGVPETCVWRISAKQGETIELTIFEIPRALSPNCERNYLEVRDGYYSKSPLLGRYCGRHIHATLKSTGAWMWVNYATHNGTDSIMFMYRAVCGGEFFKENGTIASPNYPARYHPGEECFWKITVQEEFIVVLQLKFFKLEKHKNCSYDYLAVYDGPTEASPLLGKLCGYRKPKTFKSSYNSMYVKFVSNLSHQRAGFFATFAQAVCGGEFMKETGTIASPNYPARYPPGKKCFWKITVKEGFIVVLQFKYFKLQKNPQCEYDYVAVYDGPTEASPLLGKYCGYELPETIRSSSNRLYVKFVSDENNQRIGFLATFVQESPQDVIAPQAGQFYTD